MSTTLSINNFGNLNLVEPTQFDADYPASTTVLNIKNTANYSAGDFLILGMVGTEQSEKAVIQTVTPNTSITLTTGTKFPHKRFEPIVSLFGDQVRVYRANNVDGSIPADASFASLSTFNINIYKDYTSYTDSSGSSAYWYKFTYFNSTTSAETALAGATAARGGGYGHYCSIADIRTEAGFNNNTNIPDALIDSRRIDAEGEINSELMDVYTLPFA